MTDVPRSLRKNGNVLSVMFIIFPVRYRGVARIFQKGVTLCQTLSDRGVMAFSPRNIVGCLLKKGLQRGGHGHPRIPPRYALAVMAVEHDSMISSSQPNPKSVARGVLGCP